MYFKRHYGFWMTFNWSKKPFIAGLFYSAVVTFLFLFFKETFKINIALPWQPISVLGIAVAFYLGFKNNSSYDRTWEARKIWGGIVNSSRAFGAAVTAFVQGENSDEIKRTLIYRHIAWLTALRFQLRLSREWEHKEERVKRLYSPVICEEYTDRLEKELSALLSREEMEEYKGATNVATQILA